MNFNKHKDEIAITIPYARMRHSVDGPFDNWNEVMIVTFAIDEGGVADPSTSLHFNLHTFNVRSWTEFNIMGEGRLVYGPRNPGKFVAYSILFIENDEDMQRTGELIKKTVNSDEVKNILKLIPLNPTSALVSSAVGLVGNLIGDIMSKNKNDNIMRVEGLLFRDKPHSPPYDIGTEYTEENKFLNVKVRITPLIADQPYVNYSPEVETLIVAK